VEQEQKTISGQEEISHPETSLDQDGVTTLHQRRECLRMRIQTILNRVEKFKSFVYGKVSFEDSGNGPALVVRMKPRRNSRALCSGCGRPGRMYDRLGERRFEFVPLWGILVFLAYRMRRVDCRRCGVTVEMVPWGDGKNQLTTTYRWYLASWAKRLSWSEVSSIFHTSWDSVCRAVEHAVEWGLAHRDLSELKALGVDEIAWRRGHTYLTLVYDIGAETKRLLAVEEDRTETSLRRGLERLGRPVCLKVEYVCSDMWKPYLKVIAELLSEAVHVLDRFHVMQQFGKALDQVRAEEAKRLVHDGYEPILKRSRWCFLKRPENLTDKQTVKLSEILKYNLRTVRAYLLREEFQRLWEYSSAWWAGKFLDEWTGRVMRSRLEPMKKIARSIRKHRPLILNWFRARGQVSAGAVEGLNNKVKLVTRKSYGFRTAKVARLALLHNLGRLPEPKPTHRFC
jgi:transposase